MSESTTKASEKKGTTRRAARDESDLHVSQRILNAVRSGRGIHLTSDDVRTLAMIPEIRETARKADDALLSKSLGLPTGGAVGTGAGPGNASA